MMTSSDPEQRPPTTCSTLFVRHRVPILIESASDSLTQNEHISADALAVTLRSSWCSWRPAPQIAALALPPTAAEAQLLRRAPEGKVDEAHAAVVAYAEPLVPAVYVLCVPAGIRGKSSTSVPFSPTGPGTHDWNADLPRRGAGAGAGHDHPRSRDSDDDAGRKGVYRASHSTHALSPSTFYTTPAKSLAKPAINVHDRLRRAIHARREPWAAPGETSGGHGRGDNAARGAAATLAARTSSPRSLRTLLGALFWGLAAPAPAYLFSTQRLPALRPTR
ncbi:hypothetical protein DFH09DRAFT_1273370, partial [Mycena vulgaris]